VVGIDLSGPANSTDTALSVFTVQQGKLRHQRTDVDVGDVAMLEILRALGSVRSLSVGLDAPLSYQPGGGDRPADRALRELVAAAGLHSGSVMTPTMTRMAYLTLRGMSVSRCLVATLRSCSVVEVHPGATLALRGAPTRDVRAMKRSAAARRRLRIWLDTQGLLGLPEAGTPSDHVVASWAAALAAWSWQEESSAWCVPADPPFHPFDFAA
jgi:predicted nuclease with RNAse H fold